MSLRGTSEVIRGSELENRVYDLFHSNESKVFPVLCHLGVYSMENDMIKVILNDKFVTLTIGELQITSDMIVKENKSEYNFVSHIIAGLFELLVNLMVNNKQLILTKTGFSACNG